MARLNLQNILLHRACCVSLYNERVSRLCCVMNYEGKQVHIGLLCKSVSLYCAELYIVTVVSAQMTFLSVATTCTLVDE